MNEHSWPGGDDNGGEYDFNPKITHQNDSKKR